MRKRQSLACVVQSRGSSPVSMALKPFSTALTTSFVVRPFFLSTLKHSSGGFELYEMHHSPRRAIDDPTSRHLCLVAAVVVQDKPAGDSARDDCLAVRRRGAVAPLYRTIRTSPPVVVVSGKQTQTRYFEYSTRVEISNWMLLDKTLHAHATGLQSVWNAAKKIMLRRGEDERLASRDRTGNTIEQPRQRGMYSTTQTRDDGRKRRKKRSCMTQRREHAFDIIFTRAKYM